MPSIKTILVVDDNSVNRKILHKILSSDFNILEATSGNQALDIMKGCYQDIEAVMLDLVMPGLNGYDFLEISQKNPDYSKIPVIVTTENSDDTNEIKALEMGACDFVSKPYNAKILRFRLKNAIQRSQLSAFNQLKYMVEYDTLTGIYSKSKFFEETKKMLWHNVGTLFVFIRFDIDRFGLINSFYGSDEGDNLLKYIAEILGNYFGNNEAVTYGRIEADIFAVCLPFTDSDIESAFDDARTAIASYNLNYDIVPSFGVYVIDNINLPIDIMYDRAGLAAKQCKGNYIKCYALYEEKMGEKLIKEQQITNEMNNALSQEQFDVYFQPKFDLQKNTWSGAEALVRWIHPEKGMVLPGAFIPVFERNGFISKLDFYVWERVCIILSGWMNEGLYPYPISVNVSRVNLYNPKLVDNICELVDKYKVPPRLINLELTESAYTDNPTVMKDTIHKLQSKGFIIMMDDFGSGYSSLNVLKDIEVDVLKIDTMFLSKTEIPGRGENIIASVVRMAKWLGIPVIAEGVETKEQVAFLHSIGCDFAQGYYFAKPMPISEYKDLLSEVKNVKPEVNDRQKIFVADNLWVSNPEMEMLFSNVLQAVAIYEFENENLEILRVNNAYYELFGCNDMESNFGNLFNHIDNAYHYIVMDAFKCAVQSQDVAECDYWRNCDNNKRMWIHLKLKYINNVGGKNLLFGALSDTTIQKETEMELQKYRAAAFSENKKPRSMLIVDYLDMERRALNEIFKYDYLVIEAKSVGEAISVLEKNKNIDVILLDFSVSVMDGERFLKQKNSDTEMALIPTVIIIPDSVEKYKVLSLAVNDYIVKPFTPKDVELCVRHAMESNSRFREVLEEYNDMAQLAKTDCLTGIYNRNAAEKLINDALISGGKENAFLMVDIDDFKNINDSYGHELGDRVLKECAETLCMVFGENAVIARLGGDEFIVFIPDIGDTGSIAEKCMDLTDRINCIRVEDISFSCSVGIAVSPKDGDDFLTLYRNSDKALYTAKRNGKNKFSYYANV
ncbi:MAG: EAL domain-containing protein [Oscillospiraceae bacterium]